MRTKTIIAGFVTAAAMTIGTGVSADTTIDTDVALQTIPGPGEDQVTYTGRVGSGDSRCLEGRVVNIFHQGTLIAVAITNADGFFTIVGPRPPEGDSVKAKVEKRVGPPRCGSARNTVKFLRPQGSDVVILVTPLTTPGAVRLRGTVGSGDINCLANRTVEITHEGQVIATAVTDASGNFDTTGIAEPGDVIKVRLVPAPPCPGDNESVKYTGQ